MHEKDVSYEVAVITVSTSRHEKYGDVKGVENIPEDDASGKLLVESFNASQYFLVPDDITRIQRTV